MKGRQHGFSLMEALVTLVLVLVGLMGAAKLQVRLLAASADAKARDEATAFAEDKIAEFQALTRYTEYRDRIISGRATRSGLLHEYSLDWEVQYTSDPDYKRVDVEIGWPADAPTQTVRIQTVVPGLEPARFARQQLPPAIPR